MRNSYGDIRRMQLKKQASAMHIFTNPLYLQLLKTKGMISRKSIGYFAAVATIIAILPSCRNAETATLPEEDSSGFVLVTDVVPDAILEIRYYCTYNFIGDRIPGYNEPIAIITRQAADSLKAVSDELLRKGYRLKVFDAYRPQCAVDYFMEWAKNEQDIRMKEYFYPEQDKSILIPQGYIAEKSGHTRGSTIDLTLFDMGTEREVDMGCTFDYFGLASHPDIMPGQEIGSYKPITEEQYRNRMILREAMLRHGFKPYDCEWWHFTLENEPYPDTYFTFPISTTSIRKGNTAGR